VPRVVFYGIVLAIEFRVVPLTKGSPRTESVRCTPIRDRGNVGNDLGLTFPVDGYVLNSGNPYGLCFGRPWVDDPVISDRIDGHSLLRQTKEELTSTLGSSSVEAECELVQIVVKVLMTDRSLVGSDQPSFEERDDLVHSRHQLRWSLLLTSEKRDLVFIALPFQGKVAQPAIGVNDATGCDRILHERNQAFGRSV